ncbi:MAG: ABC transporter permease [Promethearchaeota archaeon]
MAHIFIKYRLERFQKRWSQFWTAYKRNRLGIVGIFLLATILALAIFADVLTPYGPFERTNDIAQPPSLEHPLGTNRLGQDILTILFHGLRVSLAIGFVAGVFCVVLGSIIGVASGYIGGWTDEVVMRITDIILVLPALPLMLLISSLPGISLHWTLTASIYVVVFWPVSARIVRGQALSLKERAFVLSAKSAGAGSPYIIFRHILPNVFALVLTMIITSARQAILYEAVLAYLGFGDPLNRSLGLMLREAQDEAALALGAWWLIIPPGLAIAIATLSFAFIGVALDEIVNPRLRRR